MLNGRAVDLKAMCFEEVVSPVRSMKAFRGFAWF
jgi:hypothetical protein